MGVTVVKGRAGSGKSRFLMGRIKELIADPLKKIIVMVPGSLTFETEKDIMTACGVSGIMGLEVLSIQRLAMRILEETGQPEFLTHAERAMACHRALDRLEHPFGGDRLPDFEVCLAGLITRLKSHRQTPDSLREAAGRLRDAALATKLRDTADVLALYDEICGDRYDSADMYVLAAARADKAECLQGAAVFIDGLDSSTPAALHLLARVAALAEETVAVFRGDDSDPALFAPEEKLTAQFIDAMRSAGQRVTVLQSPGLHDRYKHDALRFLEANLYRYPYTPYDGPTDGLYLIEAETAQQEVERIAASILAAVSEGCRFSDIAVVGGNLAAYLPIIKSAFAQAGIPFFVDERRTLADNAFFDFLDSALTAAAGDAAAVSRYAFSDYAPIDAAQRRTLMNYTEKYALKGWHFQATFWRGEGADEAETARRQVIRPLDMLTHGIKQGGASQQAEAVRRFLSACGAQDKLDTLCADIDTPETRGEYAYFKQVYDKALEVLDSVARVMGDAPLPPDELRTLIRAGFESTRIAVIPPATDEVKLFDISVARLPGMRVLFAIGLADGAWPARDDGPGILSGAERELLLDAGLDVGVYDLSAEKLKIYTALAKPKERLVLSWNKAAGSPSVLIDRLKRLFPTLTPGGAPMIPPLSGMEPTLLGDIADALRGREPDTGLPGLCACLIDQPGWRERATAMLLRDNAAVSVSAEDAKALYGGIRCSATRIENYYKCPYRHFLDNGLRAQIPRDYTYDRIDIGTYMHLALDLFAKGLIDDGVAIQDLTEDETAQRMEMAAEEAAAQHDGGKLKEDERFAVQRALLQKELIDTVLRIRTHFMGTDARLLMSEQTFSMALPTASGDIELTGKIDRIDEADGYFRVVDYKSSETKFAPDELAAGTSLQLPIYIEAAKQKLKDTGLKPVGGYYMKIGDSYGEDEGEVLTKGRMRGISLSDVPALSRFSETLPGGSFVAMDQRVTSKGALHGASKSFFDEQELDGLLRYAQRMIREAAERVYNGDNGICPIDGTCGYCDYKSVCRMNAGYAGNALRTPPRFDREKLVSGAPADACDGVDEEVNR
jgi:ATP-dependent helicase/nuclease subunit B